jgi:hypothetical protein
MIRRLSLATALLTALVIAGNAAAQSFPPHRFFGVLTIDGQPAAATTTVRAFIGNTECASATIGASGSYVIDIPGVTINPNCGRAGQSTITFRVGDRAATQTPTYRDGGFERLDLTISGAVPPPVGFNAARINLDSPCVPEVGQRVCDATRQALWEADRTAWAARGIVEPPNTPAFTGPVFEATVVFRVQASDPAVIRNIAQILGNPFLQVTEIRFRGEEYVEITNLGGGPQNMSGWSLRSQTTGDHIDFPASLTLAGGQACRVYSATAGAMSCGPISFNNATTWPDTEGRIILNFDALDLLGDDVTYNADPNNQPPPPNLQGFNLP